MLELGPAKLPDGSSGSRRNARLLGRETCPVTAPEPRRHYDWPGGPPRTSRWEEPEDGRRDCRFDSLNAAVESGLELAGAASVAACGRMATLPWPVACEAGVGAGPLFGDPGSLSAALDAALADLSGGAGEESFEAAVEEPFGLASGDFI